MSNTTTEKNLRALSLQRLCFGYSLSEYPKDCIITREREDVATIGILMGGNLVASMQTEPSKECVEYAIDALTTYIGNVYFSDYYYADPEDGQDETETVYRLKEMPQ